ncbi:hypothetical protein V6N11_043794 [Hibiscus sabdariffa]|uniref:Uncharacterized protein n=1 Tax=Hibiscus sabdariffa TaxID=183260 RepID=A0ABR2RDT4_9ROSI
METIESEVYDAFVLVGIFEMEPEDADNIVRGDEPDDGEIMLILQFVILYTCSDDDLIQDFVNENESIMNDVVEKSFDEQGIVLDEFDCALKKMPIITPKRLPLSTGLVVEFKKCALIERAEKTANGMC